MEPLVDKIDLTPPEPGMVLRLCRWVEVFETAKSREYKSLAWTSNPTGFNSTGLQDMLDYFEPMIASAVYGAWNALIKVAAESPRRGVLAGSRGEPYTIRRIARISGFPEEALELLFRWAIEGAAENRFHWLEWVRLSDVIDSENTDGSGAVPAESAPSPQPGPARVSIQHNTTQPDQTERNGTERNLSSAAEPNRSEPVEFSFEQQIAAEPKLQALVADTITADTANRITGSVIAEFRGSDPSTQPPEFWLSWYRRQLAAPSPLFTGSNRAELSLLLALIAAVKRRPDKSITKTRVAFMCDQLSKRSASIVGPDDITAGIRAATYLGNTRAPPLPTPDAGKPKHDPRPDEISPDKWRQMPMAQRFKTLKRSKAST